MNSPWRMYAGSSPKILFVMNAQETLGYIEITEFFGDDYLQVTGFELVWDPQSSIRVYAGRPDFDP